MKVILGDNQFFGINHSDLEKGSEIRRQFDNASKIDSFIKKSLAIGIDGFMMNSNSLGHEVVRNYQYLGGEEIHFSIPYPHKFANMVNETGMLSLLKYCLKQSPPLKGLFFGSKALLTRNLKYLMPLTLQLEIPKNLKKGSYVYLQNVVTDLLLGVGKGDILIDFIKEIRRMGFKPGIITLNPSLLNESLQKYLNESWLEELVVCFNINKVGFNVFPSLENVEKLILSDPPFKLMGMSIFASGAGDICESIDYVLQFNLDYVVFGTSRVENVRKNLELLQREGL